MTKPIAVKAGLYLSLCLVLLGLTACTKSPSKPITIAINPWPGYEFLYLAEQKGFFETAGANIQLVQLSSLSDSQRAYVSGRVDGLASTLIEAVQAEHLGGKPLKVVLITDYSNGGDVILAGTDVTDVQGLKGKTVGCEVSSLGIFVLERALSHAGMTLDDVQVHNSEQAGGKALLDAGTIDAFVSYPPYSINTMKDERYHEIFSSADIPFEVIDTLSLAEEVLQANPQLVSQIHNAWQMALDFYAANPEEAVALMAKREGISAEDFKGVLSDLVVLNKAQQQPLLAEPEKLEATVQSICKTLVHVEALTVDCQQQSPLVYRGTH